MSDVAVIQIDIIYCICIFVVYEWALQLVFVLVKDVLLSLLFTSTLLLSSFNGLYN